MKLSYIIFDIQNNNVDMYIISFSTRKIINKIIFHCLILIKWKEFFCCQYAICYAICSKSEKFNIVRCVLLSESHARSALRVFLPPTPQLLFYVLNFMQLFGYLSSRYNVEDSTSNRIHITQFVVEIKVGLVQQQSNSA